MSIDASNLDHPPSSLATTTKDPDVFSREYVQELRRENEQWRHKARSHESDAVRAREEIETAKRERDEVAARAKVEAQAALSEARRTMNARIIQAELKAAALAAGMVDIDGLKLLDTSGVRLNDEGRLVVPDTFFADAKKSKPWLFGQASTSSTAATPKIEPARTKSVRDMDAKERRAFEREHGIFR